MILKNPFYFVKPVLVLFCSSWKEARTLKTHSPKPQKVLFSICALGYIQLSVCVCTELQPMPHCFWKCAHLTLSLHLFQVKAFGPGLEPVGCIVNKPAEFTIDSRGAGKAELKIYAQVGVMGTISQSVFCHQSPQLYMQRIQSSLVIYLYLLK